MGGNEHVSERLRRMPALYRKPDGSEWGGQDLENATGGAVGRSCVANLKNGRIGDPGLANLRAISKAMGFPPALWFGDTEEDGRTSDDALLAALEDETLRSIPEGALRPGPKHRRLLLRMARRVSPPPEGGWAVPEKPKPPKAPYLHVRPPRRIVGVGGEGDCPTAKRFSCYAAAGRVAVLILCSTAPSRARRFSPGPRT